MRSVFLGLLLLLAAALPTRADVTITNTVNGISATFFDADFNQLDAHDGQIIQTGTCPGADCLFYKIGTSYGCGYQWAVSSNTPYCGVKEYTSSDLIHWTYVGYLFDATTSYWQNRCSSNGGLNGCFWPRMAFNPGTGLWVLWVNQEGGGIVDAPNNFIVQTCATPAGPCTLQPEPTHLVHLPADVGSLFVDNDGSCYLAYGDSNSAPKYIIYVERLTSNCLDSTGVAGVVAVPNTDGHHEGPSMFKFGGNYYITYGPNCGYCLGGVPALYTMASAPLGSWSVGTQISTGCGTQSANADALTINGVTQFLYVGDIWYGYGNEAAANEYYHPLTFSGSAINSFSCDATVTIAGLTAGPTPAQPRPVGQAVDQTALPAVFGVDNVNPSSVHSGMMHMQTFVADKKNITSVDLELAQSSLTTDTPLDGDLTVKLMTVDGSNNPVSTLATATVARGSMLWSGRWTNVPLSYSNLTLGAAYAIVLSAVTTNGQILDAQYFGAAGNPYPAGVNRYSTDGGTTWTTLSGRAEMFSTFSPAVNSRHVRIP